MGSLIVGIALIVGALTAMHRDIRRFGCAVALMAGIVLVCRGGYATWCTVVPASFPVGANPVLSSSIAQLGSVVVVAYALLFVLGVFLIANGIVFSIHCGASRARLAPVGFGLACLIPLLWLVVGVLAVPNGPSLTSMLQTEPVLRFVVDLTLYLPFMFAAYVLYSIIYARVRARGPYDYLVVLGAGLHGERPTLLLAYRLEAAKRIFDHQDPHPMVVVTGGQGPDEIVAEAASMRNYLLERGVPSESILMEDRSTSTRENMVFSKEMMDGRGGPYTGVVVTNNFHALRAAVLARRCGLSFQSAGCGTKRTYLPAAAIREAAIFAVEYKGFAAFFALISAGAIVLEVFAPGIASLI